MASLIAKAALPALYRPIAAPAALFIATRRFISSDNTKAVTTTEEEPKIVPVDTVSGAPGALSTFRWKPVLKCGIFDVPLAIQILTPTINIHTLFYSFRLIHLHQRSSVNVRFAFSARLGQPRNRAPKVPAYGRLISMF